MRLVKSEDLVRDSANNSMRVNPGNQAQRETIRNLKDKLTRVFAMQADSCTGGLVFSLPNSNIGFSLF